MTSINDELSYHRRRAAEEQGRSEGAMDLAAARCHSRLALLHGQRAERIARTADRGEPSPS